MVQFKGNPCESESPVGPLLDEDEFKLLQPYVCPEWNGKFGELPKVVRHRPFWQHGTGSHASKLRFIIGSVYINARSYEGAEVRINYLIIEGSSQ